MKKVLVIGIVFFSSLSARATSPTPSNLQTTFFNCLNYLNDVGLCMVLTEYTHGSQSLPLQLIAAIDPVRAAYTAAANDLSQKERAYLDARDNYLRAIIEGGDVNGAYQRMLQAEFAYNDLLNRVNNPPAYVAFGGNSGYGAAGNGGNTGNGATAYDRAQQEIATAVLASQIASAITGQGRNPSSQQQNDATLALLAIALGL